MRLHRLMLIASSLVVALVLGAAGYTAYRAFSLKGPNSVVETYFDGVVSGDDSKVQSVLTGSALTSFRRASAGKPRSRAEVTNLQSRWVVTGSTLAVADVTVQVKQSNLVDVQTARISVTLVAGQWRIYQVEAAPLAYDGGPAASKQDAVQLVKTYLNKVLSGDYDAALSFLAGEARAEAESTLSVVKQAQLDVRADGLKVASSETRGGSVWVTASYTASIGEKDARPVTLLLEVRSIGGKLAIVKSNSL